MATAGLIAANLEDAGWCTTTKTDVDAALADVGGADLVVVNAGDPWRNGEVRRGANAATAAGLVAAVSRGVGFLAVHNSLSSLRDYPLWRTLLGGEWEVGRTWHPPLGRSTIEVVRDHPVTAGLTTFEIEDEVYLDLAVDDVTVLAVHRRDDIAYPIAWVTHHDASRVVVCALGHDERSFASPEHRQLLRQAAAWAARRD